MDSDISARGAEPGCKAIGSLPEGDRRCPTCNTRRVVSDAGEYCPVCLLRAAVVDVEANEETLASYSVSTRFGQYELVLGQDGLPIELGRGGMGITYRAVDIDLQCSVALKFIRERYVGDETARLRFVREARAAASVRHPNVASVFHLGRTTESYFYAMEFVEGETLERIIRRGGRLELKLVLQIATQVCAGLAAIHKQKLVHRDIKPSNIMVSLEDGGLSNAKIIDLGLAKVINDPGSQMGISVSGGFVGTPEFASPEQFAGVGVDIRSDLYSLGVVLWAMLTGHSVFRGSPAELMYQHQHEPLPLEQLESPPQPIILLVKKLLEKDPSQRFQSPSELSEVMPAIIGAVEAGRKVTRASLRLRRSAGGRAISRPSERLGPERISIARLPITGNEVFGREDDLAFLDEAWANKHINVVTIVGWAGLGKSTLVNAWLERLATEQYRSAELVFGWSFYRQGKREGSSSAEEFFDCALRWFGDSDPRVGTPWEKGERLAKLVARRRTLLVLDGLEPLQNAPGAQEGRLREISLQALLRELAAFSKGLCLITTRMPVADLAGYESASAVRRDLEHLSSEAGAELLRALGVRGGEPELQDASEEFNGHPLALTLLGSYLTDAYRGDVRRRDEVSRRLAHDVRQGAHARKVMASYETWFGEGPELSVLRILGLFDRPADESAIQVLLKPPGIQGVTESLVDLSPAEWRAVLAKLRRARLLSHEDKHNSGQLDAHPLVREYFGEQIRTQCADGWKLCNTRLYRYYQAFAPQLPNSFKEMEPLFLAAISACHAGLLRDALHEVYIPRIQRGDENFSGKVLGVRGTLLSVLVHFFEDGRWGSPRLTDIQEQKLSADDDLFILRQASLYLSITRGFAAPEARICYERMETLGHSLGLPLVLFSALDGQWRYSLVADRLGSTLQLAKRIHALAQEQKDCELMIGAYRALSITHYYLGNFKLAGEFAASGVQVWRSGCLPQRSATIKFPLGQPLVACFNYQALCDWHLKKAAHETTMAEAASLAKKLNDMHALAMAQFHGAFLAYFERNAVEVERWASDLVQLATRYNFPYWLAAGIILRGWARSVMGDAKEGVSWIEGGIAGYSATGSRIGMPFFLAVKGEALHLAGCTSSALAAVNEAEEIVERTQERWWSAELHRLRGVFIAAKGANENDIRASLQKAVDLAKEQKSISLTRRAEECYAAFVVEKENFGRLSLP